ncbi:MAG: protein kinase [Gemmatimonadota bacterium]|nr:protein kinase [Gemmatimonadota bacterium]
MSDAAGNIESRLRASLHDRYRLERELGQGGMATVYLAEDLKHHRKVAIKVLRPELAAVIGAERFLSEIKTTANLQHPHILPLFDSGAADSFLFYVMPFIDGESLRDRLTREKQLPVADAVRIASEVASALDYAHRHNVIHRDIKPENILLHDGRALVADFGIALAASKAGGSRMTETGMSLGTPTYMSPEQAMGEREITARSDVYALGCVTYEMLLGEPPFTGPTAQAIVAKVMTAEPVGITGQRKTVPPHVEAAVLTALQKTPADRFASAAEFAAALGDPAFAGPAGGSTRMTARVVGASGRLHLRPPLAAASALLLAVLGLGAGWALWHQSGPTTPPVVLRYTMTQPDSARYVISDQDPIAFATDGSVFAYPSTAGLQLRYLDRTDPVPLPGGRKGNYPAFSPDGRWLAFRDGLRLLKVPLAGGAPVVICDSCIGFGNDWGIDDSIRYHAPLPGNVASRVLMVVPAGGGTPREFARPDSGSGEVYRYPLLLPDRRTVLFTLRSRDTDRLAALDLRTHAITRFEQAGGSPRWVADGYVVLGNADQSLIAVPFDLRHGRPSGPPVTIARDVSVGNTGGTAAGVSLDGALVYAPSLRGSKRQLIVVSREGRATDLMPELRGYSLPRLSPDGRRLAVGIFPDDGTSDVWVLDLAQRVWSRVTTAGQSDHPVWTPDGRRLVFARDADLWWIAADGSGHADSLLMAAGSRYPSDVTPDGQAVIFHEFGSTSSGIRRLVFDSAPAATTILPPAYDEAAPALSPDGGWLAYQSDETGRSEIYLRPYPGPGARVSLSAEGGAEPAWSRDGRSLYYRAGDSMMVALTGTTGTGLTVTGRRLLFRGRFVAGDRFRGYDVSPDGQRFYLLRGSAAPSTLVAVHHFFDRLAFEQRRKP